MNLYYFLDIGCCFGFEQKKIKRPNAPVGPRKLIWDFVIKGKNWDYGISPCLKLGFYFSQ